MEGGTREGSLMRQPERLPSWATSGAMGAVSAQYDAASQLAAAAARLSTCAAHLSGLAAKAAMVPIHSTYAQLSDEIRRYEAWCMPTWPSMQVLSTAPRPSPQVRGTVQCPPGQACTGALGRHQQGMTSDDH